LKEIKPLDIEFICPGHGPILGQNYKKIVELTEKYSNDYLNTVNVDAKRKILIAYVSAYGFTGKAAELIASGIRETEDFKVVVADIENMATDELDSLICSSDALLIGSPTINQNTLLPVYRMFSLINPIRDKGKLAGSFGSYGWSGEAPKIILDVLRSLKLKVIDEPAAFKFYPAGSKEDDLKLFGKKFAVQFALECAEKKIREGAHS
jgi:flavorubredoxin